jgi:hypothetical protein
MMNMNKDERKPMVLAVDFDGVLCEDKYPKIGKADKDMLVYFINRRAAGDKIILWTCRKGIYLNNAVAWCKKRGLEFDAVNENLPEYIKKYGGDTRKVFADLYFDDRNGEHLFREPEPPKNMDHIAYPDWQYKYHGDNNEVIYSAAHCHNLIMILNLVNGTVKIIDYGRVNFTDIKSEAPYKGAMKGDVRAAAVDYIHAVYPIQLPYIAPLDPYDIIGSGEFIKYGLFYVAGVRKPDGGCIDVDQWFTYNPEEHILTPISIRKRNRIIRKFRRIK